MNYYVVPNRIKSGQSDQECS